MKEFLHSVFQLLHHPPHARLGPRNNCFPVSTNPEATAFLSAVHGKHG